MNFNGPGWAFTAALYSFCILAIVRSQHELHEGSEGKNHLSGIHRLPIRRIGDNRPVQISSASAAHRQQHYYPFRNPSSYGISSNEDQETQQQQRQSGRTSWPHWRPRSSPPPRRIVPFAVAPILSSASYEKSREIGYRFNNERRIKKLPVATARGAPTQIYNVPMLHKHETSEEIKHPPHAIPSHVESSRSRLQRLEARWRKIGPLIGSSSSSRFARMRLVNRLHPVAWTHSPTTEEPTTTPRVFTTPETTTPAPTTTATTTELPWLPETVVPEVPIPPSRPILPEIVKATTEPPMIRRQHKQLHIESTQVLPSRFKAFGSRSRFNGPILEETLPTEEVIPPSRLIERTKSFERFETPEQEASPNSLIFQDTTRNDYHSRQTVVGASPVKRFKFTNKLSYRPRLKIRRPEEQFAARADSNTKSFPLALPELAPIGHSHSQRQPLPTSNFEPTNAFMARHRASPEQVDIHQAHGLRPLPVPGLGAEDNVQVEPPPRTPKKPPTVTDWGDDFTAPVSEGGGDSGDSGVIGSGNGDSGSAFGFGGDIGTPPPGFFGITGEMTAPPPPTTEATTTTQRTTPPPPPPPPAPEEPFIIPENSGLRPVAPPREFQGGFGSAKGSSLSGFGNGGGGGFGGGGGGLPPAPPPPAPRRPKNQMQEEFNEEDFFTGDSALSPNKRGPSGDGFGPPVFPGAAAPPPVPSVGLGGGAAGIPPSPPPYRMVNTNENEATTVKPSALLSMLNKADQGFNQAITHLQEGTPPEAAFIDILEVALGSQKLDSQAKLLGHVDRTIGLDNLQRLQRWANTGGAFDMVKEQLAKVLKNYKPPESVKAVTIPPQFEYLFAPTG